MQNHRYRNPENNQTTIVYVDFQKINRLFLRFNWLFLLAELKTT